MTAVTTIQKVLKTSLLLPELTIVPERGATAMEIHSEERRLARQLSETHKHLLRQWNGIGLEVIRFFGCGESASGIGRIGDFQLGVDTGEPRSVVIGADASGFAYLETSTGQIRSFDTDGGAIRNLALNLDDFVDRLLFGRNASEFAGDDWLEQIKNCGLLK